jgi:DNA modification methylase
MRDLIGENQAPFALHLGDCIEVMRGMSDSSVDAIVTDPPYELGFMGKSWDASGIAYNVDQWREALRVLKPGGHLLAFSGSRTYHRMAVAIEDAGFEVRDQIMWVYGSGFPKSLDVSKAIDKARDDRDDILRVTTCMAEAAERAGISRAEVDKHMGTSDMGGWWLSKLRRRCQCPKWEQWLQLKEFLRLSDEMDTEVWRLNGRKGQPGEAWQTADVLAIDVRMNEPSGIVGVGQGERVEVERQIKAANSDAARQWSGWGTALKPAHEPICVARKPLAGTVAANVLQFGTGALNIDGSRVSGEDGTTIEEEVAAQKYARNYVQGRWPANLIHDGSDEVVALFPTNAGQSGPLKTRNSDKTRHAFGEFAGSPDANFTPHDERGSAARFFYCAKASRTDRNEGLSSSSTPVVTKDATMRECETAARSTRNGNHHPTVKPTDLMAYLVRLVTPPGGLVLDPFMGSGSTGKACMREGFRFIGIDMTPEYVEIAKARIAHEWATVVAAVKAAAAPAPQRDLFEEMA